MRVRKKPLEVHALQYVGHNDFAISQFAGQPLVKNEEGKLEIPTLEGVMYASKGDFIIRGIKGELYPIKPDLFYETYDIIE